MAEWRAAPTAARSRAGNTRRGAPHRPPNPRPYRFAPQGDARAGKNGGGEDRHPGGRRRTDGARWRPAARGGGGPGQGRQGGQGQEAGHPETGSHRAQGTRIPLAARARAQEEARLARQGAEEDRDYGAQGQQAGGPHGRGRHRGRHGPIHGRQGGRGHQEAHGPRYDGHHQPGARLRHRHPGGERVRLPGRERRLTSRRLQGRTGRGPKKRCAEAPGRTIMDKSTGKTSLLDAIAAPNVTDAEPAAIPSTSAPTTSGWTAGG